MSVQIQKDRIIITIPSTQPEEDLNAMQSDIIYAIQCYDPRNSAYSFFQLLELLNAMRPDSSSYQIKEEEEPKHNMEPLTKLVSSYDPFTLAHIFTTAQMYIWKYATLQNKKDVELEDTAADIKGFSDVFLQMAKQADKVCV